MFGEVGSRISKTLKQVSRISKGAAIAQVQAMLLPHIMRVFHKHGHEELRRYIVVNYPLVEQKTPDGLRKTLSNLGSNPEIRQQWEGWVLQTITPENIVTWLRNPEEWLDAEDAAEQRAELKRCADVLEETPGGMDWLEVQVLDLYRMAGIIPEDADAGRDKRVEAND